MQQHLMAILSEVRRTNSRIDDFESQLKSVEQSQHTTPSSSSSSAAPKRKVPPYIRVRIINQCWTLLYVIKHFSVLIAIGPRSPGRESDEFMGFHLECVISFVNYIIQEYMH